MMGALENAKKLNREKIIEEVKIAGLREFGVYNGDLAERWYSVLEEKKGCGQPIQVIAAINNNDTSRILLSLLRTKITEILTGIRITAYALDAEEMQLYVPEGEQGLIECIRPAAQAAGVELYEGMVDVRASRGSSVNHIETMLALGELFDGKYEPGTWMSICRDGIYSELEKIPFGKSVKELINSSKIPGVSGGGIKGILIGSRLYDSSGLDVVVAADTNIGNGVITILPDTCCIIDEAEKILLSERENGCGKCTFCREGLGQLYAMTEEVTGGKGKTECMDMLKEISEAMAFSSLCSIGQTGADFTKGSLDYFAEEYIQHIKKKRCPADICSAFVNIYIDPNLCEGCEECADVCPVGCIEGKRGFIHMIDEFECTKCGKCIEVCGCDAITKATGRIPKLPTRLVKCGKFKKR